MKLVRVVAIRSFEHEGRLIHCGEALSLDPIEAGIQQRKGHVSLDAYRRATYQRRDLVAESPELVISPIVVMPPPGKETDQESLNVASVKRRRGRPRKIPVP